MPVIAIIVVMEIAEAIVKASSLPKRSSEGYVHMGVQENVFNNAAAIVMENVQKTVVEVAKKHVPVLKKKAVDVVAIVVIVATAKAL